MIHIVFACDDNYAQHAGVAIVSLREQQRKGLPVHVHVLDGGISPVNLGKLKELKDRHLDITIHQGNIEEYAQYLVLEHFSTAMYLRLSVEQILPPEIERIIYCDCDIVFLKPIDELWNTDLGGQWLAAVGDPPNPPNLWRKDLGIDEPGRYFNSGVLLIDLNLWRDHHICQQAKNFITSHWDTIRFPDQDGLNAILYKNWHRLDNRWNTLTFLVDKKKMPDPAIVHYATEFKPWLYRSFDVYQGEYLKYLRLSPWRDYQFPDKNLWVWIYRMILLYTPEKVMLIVFQFSWRWRNLLKECNRQITLMKMNRKPS